MLFRH